MSQLGHSTPEWLREIVRVVVTGSPCTGKTTLAGRLATSLGTVWSPEYSRIYQAERSVPLTSADVEPIARGQILAEQEAAMAATRLVILDTDLASTVTYSRHYYGGCPEWIARAARQRRADLYLLLHPDVPWVEDGLQRDRPHQREEIHALFVTTLSQLGARVVDVRGPWEQRDAIADRAIAALLDERGSAQSLRAMP